MADRFEQWSATSRPDPPYNIVDDDTVFVDTD